MKQRLFQKIRAIFANAAPVQVVSFARPVGAYASWIGGASDAALDESYCRGAVVRVGWKDVETSPGVYSWTALDGYVNDCKSRGKKWTLAVGAGTPGCPQWVTDGASQTYTIYFRPQDNPDPFTIAAGWDTYYLSRLQSFMTALAARYGSDPDLQMVYVPQQTGNGIEGHFNANTDSSLTAQGINATSWVQCSKQAAHIVAAAFPNKSVAFEVHKVISSSAIPMQIVEEMHAETSGQVGAAIWWLKGNMTEQSGLIDALYTYAGNIYAQPIGNSGDASRFPTSADYLAVITQAMELGCLYVEFWDYEYLNDTFPTNIAQYNAWCDGSIATVYSLYAVAAGNDVAITWENPHVNDHSVIVQRNGATIATLSSGSTSYNDIDVASGSHTYRVYIEQHGVFSDWVSDSVVVGASDSVTITGTGFGIAPNVILYRTLDGTPGELVSLAPPAGEIGTFSVCTMRHAPGGGANGFDSSTQRAIEFIAPSSFKRFSIFTDLKVPDGSYPPGGGYGTDYQTWGTQSAWKAVWLMDSGDGNSIGWESDICVPTMIGSGSMTLGGNTNAYGYYYTSVSNNTDRWSWNDWNNFGFIHDTDLSNPCTIDVSHRVFMSSAQTGVTKTVGTIEAVFSKPGYPIKSERIYFESGGIYQPAHNDTIFGVSSGTSTALLGSSSGWRVNSGALASGDAAGEFFFNTSAPDTWQAGEQINITKASDGSTVTDAATVSTGITLPGMANTDCKFDRVKYNAYALKHDIYPERTQAMYRHLYLAVESSDNASDYKQRVFLGNGSTLAACTAIKPKVATVWTDTSVTVPVSDAEKLEYTHALLQKADGSVISVGIV